MNNRQVKMKALARVLKIICNVGFWISAIGFGIFLLASIIFSIIPKEAMVVPASSLGSLSATIGGTMVFKLDPQTIGDIYLKSFLQALFMWICLGALMVSIVFFEVKRILKTVVADHPFEKGNSTNLTVIGITLIAGSLIMPTLQSRVFHAIIDTLKITNINFSYSVDCTLLFTGIIILILAGVFQYGNYLQEEVDSTL